MTSEKKSPGDAEGAPLGGGAEPLGEGLGEALCSVVDVVADALAVEVAVAETVAVAVALAEPLLPFKPSKLWTIKYPAATMPIRSIGRRIKSQSLPLPPPDPLITASGCPHSGQIGAPSKRIWSPV